MAFLQSIPIATRREILFRLTNPTTGLGVPGQTFAGAEIQIRKAGGTLTNAANVGSVPEIGSTGVYVYTATTAELNTPGPLLFRVNKTGALIVDKEDEVLPATFGSVVTGTLGASAFTTDLTQADNFWKDVLLRFLTGNLTGQTKKIGAFANAGGLVSLATGLAFSAAPSNGDVFRLIVD